MTRRKEGQKEREREEKEEGTRTGKQADWGSWTYLLRIGESAMYSSVDQ